MAGRRDVEAGSAYVRLWMNSTEFDRGVRTLKRNLNDVGNWFAKVGGVIAFAGTAITGAIVSATRSFATFGDDLNDMAVRTGISASSLSELKYAADKSGASLTALERAIKSMQRVLYEAFRGTKTYVEILDSLGISAESLEGIGVEKQFVKIATAVAAIEDPMTRAALAMKIFGRSGVDILPMITGDMTKLRREAEELGLTISEESAESASKFDDAMVKLTSSGEAVWKRIGEAAAPTLTTIADVVAGYSTAVQEWIGNNQEFVATTLKVSAGITAVGYGLLQLGGMLKTASIAVAGLSTAMTFLAAHPVAIVIAAFVAAAGAIAYFESTAQRLPSVMGEVRQKSDEMRAADQALMKELAGLSEKQKLTNEEMERANEIIDTLEGRYGDLGLSIDGTAGKIDGMADAQAKLNEAMKRAAVGQLRAEAQALEAEIAGMEAARDTWWSDVKRGASSWMGGDAGAVEAAKIQAEYARLDALRARIRAAEGGDTDALTAGATATAGTPGVPVIAGPPAGYEFDENEPGAWSGVDFEAMRAESDAYFEEIRQQEEAARRKAEANQRFSDDTKRLEIEQGITDEKEKQRRLIEFEREIALRGVGEGGADADNVNAYFDARLAGIKDVVKQQQAGTGPSGTFSTAAALAMTGRTAGNEQQRTAKATEETAKKMGTVLETLAKMVGAPQFLVDELKKAFSFG